MTCRIMTGGANFFLIGAYIAPGNDATIDIIREQLRDTPEGFRKLVFGDLNAPFRVPMDPREDRIADAVDEADLINLPRHY